jgi:hypothetical protein
MYPGNRFWRYLLPPLQGRTVLYMAIIVVWVQVRNNDDSLVTLVTVLSFLYCHTPYTCTWYPSVKSHKSIIAVPTTS